MKKVLFIAGLVSTMLLAACNSEENVVKEDGKVNVAKGITFQFTEEEYVPGVVGEEKAGAKGTRAVQSETVDFGNGLVAELSLEPDTMATAKTRAPQPISDGHYTIYAVDASNVRHDGIKGTVTSGVFTPDGATDWMLNPGETYTFVCFNDAVTDNGTSLRYAYTTPGGIDENAMIGVTTHTVSTTAHDVVSCTMRHQNARMCYQVTTYTAPITSPTFEVVWTDPYGDKAIRDYDLIGNETAGSLNNCHLTNIPLAITPDRAISYSPYVEAYKATTTRYLYVPGGSTRIWGQDLKITGTLYGKALNVDTYFMDALATTYPKYQKNHSYVFNVKLKSKDPLYLYQDGTVGYLGDKGTRTPIGVVVKEKTTGTEGTAIALTDATTPATHQAWGKLGVSPQLLNTTQSTDFNTQLADIDGYHWTYDASGSQDGTVKANNSTLGSFYTAANYNSTTPPAFSGERLGKWYLPSLGEWALALKSLAKVTYFPTTMEEYGGSSLPTTKGEFDWTTLNTAFTAVGGTALEDYWYWASGEYNGQQATVVCFDKGPAQNIFTFGTDDKHYIGCCVRAFIHF